MICYTSSGMLCIALGYGLDRDPQAIQTSDSYPFLFVRVEKSVEISASQHIFKAIAKFRKLLI